MENQWAVTLVMSRVIGEYLRFFPPDVEDESQFGAQDRIKTSNFMILQSEIGPLN